MHQISHAMDPPQPINVLFYFRISTSAQPQQIKFDGLYQMLKGQEKNALNITCYGSSPTNQFTSESQLQLNHSK